MGQTDSQSLIINQDEKLVYMYLDVFNLVLVYYQYEACLITTIIKEISASKHLGNVCKQKKR